MGTFQRVPFVPCLFGSNFKMSAFFTYICKYSLFFACLYIYIDPNKFVEKKILKNKKRSGNQANWFSTNVEFNLLNIESLCFDVFKPF